MQTMMFVIAVLGNGIGLTETVGVLDCERKSYFSLSRFTQINTRCTSTKCGFQTTDGAPEHFVLQRFDTASFCCVINKCQTYMSDKLEKCCVVVFNMSKFISNKENSRTTLIFVFI